MTQLDFFSTCALVAGSAILVSAVLPYTFFCMMIPSTENEECKS